MTWLPGHLTTWLPGHLTTWLLGHLTTCDMTTCHLTELFKAPSLNPSLGFLLSSIHLPPDKQLICLKYVPVVVINFLVHNLCSRESSGGPRAPSPAAAPALALPRLAGQLPGEPRPRQGWDTLGAKTTTNYVQRGSARALLRTSIVSPRPNPCKESLAAPRELRGNGARLV